eukprot:288737-Amphidinium_carterae.1
MRGAISKYVEMTKFRQRCVLSAGQDRAWRDLYHPRCAVWITSGSVLPERPFKLAPWVAHHTDTHLKMHHYKVSQTQRL